jgi:hypothetical protein
MCVPALQDSIANWLDGLLSGKVRTAPMQQLPEFSAADAADAGVGLAAEEAPVEEEFDLSDIMNVSVAKHAFVRVCSERVVCCLTRVSAAQDV